MKSPDDIAARISSRMDSATYRKNLFLYVLVEELIALAHCVCVSAQHRAPGREEKDSNLLPSEEESLSAAFSSHGKIAASGRPQADPNIGGEPRGCTKAYEARGLDEHPLRINNGNLEDVDFEIRLTVEAHAHCLSVAMWFDASDDGAEIARAVKKGGLEPLLSLLNQLEILFNKSIETPGQDEMDSDFLSISEARRRSFMEDKEDFFSRVNTNDKQAFVQEYKSRFRPIELITQRLEQAIRHRLKKIDETYSHLPLVFSFRSTGERHISFYLTSAQLKQLFDARQNCFTIAELRKLLQFEFAEGVGLSGYVLKTGHSDFTLDPRDDPRWTKNTTKQQETTALNLLDKMYEILGGDGESTGNTNVFLLPLFVHSHMPPDDSQYRNSVQLLVECKLPSGPETRQKLRAELLNIQWEYMPLVEAAILAQEQTQLQADAEVVRFITTHAWALGHNFPKFLSKPIINIATELEHITQSLYKELNSQLTPEQTKKLNRVRNVLSYMPLMAGHYSEFFTFFVGSLPGPKVSGRPSVEVKDELKVEEMKEKMENFVVHYRDVLANTNRQTIGSPSIEYQRMCLGFHPFNECYRTRILYNKSLFFELLLNHLGNSMDELARDNGQLISGDHSRAKVHIYLDLENSSSTSEVGFLHARVVDHGPGMPAEHLAQRNSELERIFKTGETPRLHSGTSTKAEHTGSGFLINAHILQSFRDSELKKAGTMWLEATNPADEIAPGLTVHLKIPVRVAKQK